MNNQLTQIHSVTQLDTQLDIPLDTQLDTQLDIPLDIPLEIEILNISDVYSHYNYTENITFDHLKVPWKKLKKRMKLNRIYQYINDNYSIESNTTKTKLYRLLIDMIDDLNVKYDKCESIITCIISHNIVVTSDDVRLIENTHESVVIKKKAVIQYY